MTQSIRENDQTETTDSVATTLKLIYVFFCTLLPSVHKILFYNTVNEIIKTYMKENVSAMYE